MKLRYESVIVDLAVRILVPFIQIFALYVVTHGHYSPGGGFQGGAILAASILLLRLSLGQEHAARRFPTKVMLPLGGLGVLIYALNGVLVMPLGGNFLDYGLLPLPGGLDEAHIRAWGSLIVEIGVALGVLGIMSLFWMTSWGGKSKCWTLSSDTMPTTQRGSDGRRHVGNAGQEQSGQEVDRHEHLPIRGDPLLRSGREQARGHSPDS